MTHMLKQCEISNKHSISNTKKVLKNKHTTHTTKLKMYIWEGWLSSIIAIEQSTIQIHLSKKLKPW